MIVQTEISGMGGHIATLLTPSWRALPGELHKLLFESIQCLVWEKKPLEVFTGYVLNQVHARLIFLLPWARWFLPTTTKLLEHFQRVCIEGNTFHTMGRVGQTAFRPYMMCASREKALESFLPFTRCAVSFLVTLGRMNLVHYKKVFGTFSKGMRWRTRPPHHRYYSCYCYLREWATDTSHYEKLITR